MHFSVFSVNSHLSSDMYKKIFLGIKCNTKCFFFNLMKQERLSNINLVSMGKVVKKTCELKNTFDRLRIIGYLNQWRSQGG